MFGLFKRKKPYEQEIWPLFQIIQEQARAPVFYTDFAAPDTMEGRYDLLLIHLFLVMRRLKAEGKAGEDAGQALFDTVFQHIDEGYREIGVGDMGVPKRMKKLMLAFNGRIYRYESALVQKDVQAALEAALDRNLYNIVKLENDAILPAMASYILENNSHLKSVSFGDIIEGKLTFKGPSNLPSASQDKV